MLNHYNDNHPNWWIERFEAQGYELVTTSSYLTARQLQLWNLNAILHRLLSINVLKRQDIVLENEGLPENSCTLLVFRKS